MSEDIRRLFQSAAAVEGGLDEAALETAAGEVDLPALRRFSALAAEAVAPRALAALAARVGPTHAPRPLNALSESAIGLAWLTGEYALRPGGGRGRVDPLARLRDLEATRLLQRATIKLGAHWPGLAPERRLAMILAPNGADGVMTRASWDGLRMALELAGDVAYANQIGPDLSLGRRAATLLERALLDPRMPASPPTPPAQGAPAGAFVMVGFDAAGRDERASLAQLIEGERFSVETDETLRAALVAETAEPSALRDLVAAACPSLGDAGAARAAAWLVRAESEASGLAWPDLLALLARFDRAERGAAAPVAVLALSARFARRPAWAGLTADGGPFLASSRAGWSVEDGPAHAPSGLLALIGSLFPNTSAELGCAVLHADWSLTAATLAEDLAGGGSAAALASPFKRLRPGGDGALFGFSARAPSAWPTVAPLILGAARLVATKRAADIDSADALLAAADAARRGARESWTQRLYPTRSSEREAALGDAGAEENRRLGGLSAYAACDGRLARRPRGAGRGVSWFGGLFGGGSSAGAASTPEPPAIEPVAELGGVGGVERVAAAKNAVRLWSERHAAALRSGENAAFDLARRAGDDAAGPEAQLAALQTALAEPLLQGADRARLSAEAAEARRMARWGVETAPLWLESAHTRIAAAHDELHTRYRETGAEQYAVAAPKPAELMAERAAWTRYLAALRGALRISVAAGVTAKVPRTLALVGELERVAERFELAGPPPRLVIDAPIRYDGDQPGAEIARVRIEGDGVGLGPAMIWVVVSSGGRYRIAPGVSAMRLAAGAEGDEVGRDDHVVVAGRLPCGFWVRGEAAVERRPGVRPAALLAEGAPAPQPALAAAPAP